MDLLKRFGLSLPCSDEPTTSSVTNPSSEPKESPSSETSASESKDYLHQLMANNPQVPPNRKHRSLAETIDLLKKQREAQEMKVEPPLPLFWIPLYVPPVNNTGFPEGVAEMINNERERVVAQEVNRIADQIKATFTPTSPLEEKRLACHVCGKRFANKFLLNKHLFIHTGRKPHQCPNCFKCFNRSDNMLRHRRNCKGYQLMNGPDRPNALGGFPPLNLQGFPSLNLPDAFETPDATPNPSQTEATGTSSTESFLLELFSSYQQKMCTNPHPRSTSIVRTLPSSPSDRLLL